MAVRVFWCFLERDIMILLYGITMEKSRKKSDYLDRRYHSIEKSNGWGIRCGGCRLYIWGRAGLGTANCYCQLPLGWNGAEGQRAVD
jgi:hypothetical protein